MVCVSGGSHRVRSGVGVGEVPRTVYKQVGDVGETSEAVDAGR